MGTFNELSIKLQYAGYSPYSESSTVYRCVFKTKEARLILQSGIYIFWPIFRKARPSFFRVKKEGRAFRSIGQIIYIPDCKISLASFVLYFHLLLIRSFIRIRSFFFCGLVLASKIECVFKAAFPCCWVLKSSREPAFHSYISFMFTCRQCQLNICVDL